MAASEFYGALFSSELGHKRINLPHGRFHRFSNDELRPLTMSISNDERLCSVLPRSVVDQMATIPLPRDSYGEDRPCWRLENNQKFWLKSAYASSHSTLGCDNRHLVEDDKCPFCSHEVESLEHVLRHYTFAANVEKNDPTTGFGCVQLNGLGRLLSLQFIATHNGCMG
ncbi:hypothetical protein V6N13_143205 [Hibiscus sabdariffa]